MQLLRAAIVVRQEPPLQPLLSQASYAAVLHVYTIQNKLLLPDTETSNGNFAKLELV